MSTTNRRGFLKAAASTVAAPSALAGAASRTARTAQEVHDRTEYQATHVQMSGGIQPVGQGTPYRLIYHHPTAADADLDLTVSIGPYREVAVLAAEHSHDISRQTDPPEPPDIGLPIPDSNHNHDPQPGIIEWDDAPPPSGLRLFVNDTRLRSVVYSESGIEGRDYEAVADLSDVVEPGSNEVRITAQSPGAITARVEGHVVREV